MLRYLLAPTSLLASLTIGSLALAERPPESREDATHIVVGEVESVFSYETRTGHHFVVKIVIEELEKGTGCAAGDAFYVECFQRKKTAPRVPAPYGHKSVPKPDQRIRAWVIRDGPRCEGIYPDWYEALKSP